METVTFTFWLTMLCGALAFGWALFSAWYTHCAGFHAESILNEARHAVLACERDAYARKVARIGRADWRLSHENVHAFLTLSRSKAAQQGRCTRLHTLALSRMGEV